MWFVRLLILLIFLTISSCPDWRDSFRSYVGSLQLSCQKVALVNGKAKVTNVLFSFPIMMYYFSTLWLSRCIQLPSRILVSLPLLSLLSSLYVFSVSERISINTYVHVENLEWIALDVIEIEISATWTNP